MSEAPRLSARAYWEARGYPQVSYLSGDAECGCKGESHAVREKEGQEQEAGLLAMGLARLQIEQTRPDRWQAEVEVGLPICRRRVVHAGNLDDLLAQIAATHAQLGGGESRLAELADENARLREELEAAREEAVAAAAAAAAQAARVAAIQAPPRRGRPRKHGG